MLLTRHKNTPSLSLFLYTDIYIDAVKESAEANKNINRYSPNQTTPYTYIERGNNDIVALCRFQRSSEEIKITDGTLTLKGKTQKKKNRRMSSQSTEYAVDALGM